MAVWTSGSDIINLGRKETKHCKNCESDQDFYLMLYYKYRGLYWVFNTVSSKKYFLLCKTCKKGEELDAGKVESTLPAAPIPFMRQYGFILLLGGGIVILIFSALFKKIGL